MQIDWKEYFWANAISGYIQTITRLALGLILFRQLFSGLTTEEFGFWSLMWSLFGYGVLLDFGFGFTAQKVVAEKTATNDIQGLNRLLSTIFWVFIGLAILMGITFWAIRPLFLQSLSFDPIYNHEFNKAYAFFFLGMALMFPIGIFSEILRGLQRLDWVNAINSINSIIHFIALTTAIYAQCPFSSIMAISVASSLIPNLFAALIAFRKLNGLSLSFLHFDFSAIKHQLQFSITAYLITFSNLIMSKTDQFVIGVFLTLGAITIYQSGYKIGEMLNLFSIQLQSMLSPAAAHLNAKNDRAGLTELLLKGSRLTFLFITPFYFLSAAYIDPLIKVLTGLKEVPRETFWVGQTLLLAIYSSQLTNSCSKRVLMMCGHEKVLLHISLADAISNLILSILLALKFGVLGVALGTCIPTLFWGWGILIPWTLRFIHLDFTKYIQAHLKETIQPLGTFFILLISILLFCPMPEDGAWGSLVWRGFVAGTPSLILSWKVFKSMKN